MQNVAIIDYGVGNLFSVAQACTRVGLSPQITSDPEIVLRADGVILPGVGAFGYAMSRLQSLGMVEAVLQVAGRGTPLLGICLGFQLLFDASEEMAHTAGLALVPGIVRPLAGAVQQAVKSQRLRVPNVSWLPLLPCARTTEHSPWRSTLLETVESGEEMYFVHSYYADTPAASAAIAETEYCGFRYCCAVSTGNLFGCQFHPEKSGAAGLKVYQQFAKRIQTCTSGFSPIFNRQE